MVRKMKYIQWCIALPKFIFLQKGTDVLMLLLIFNNYTHVFRFSYAFKPYFPLKSIMV